MAKANHKTILESSMWDMHFAHGRFVPRIRVNARKIKKSQRKKQERLQKERRIIKSARFAKTRKFHQMVKPDKLAKQIQYGFDLVEWWELQHAV